MDLVITNARLVDRPGDGPLRYRGRGWQDRRDRPRPRRGCGETYDAGGRLVCAGLIETHIHLDKSRIAGRCPLPDGRRVNPVTMTAPLKKDFTRRGRLRSAPRRHCANAWSTARRGCAPSSRSIPAVGLRGFEAVAGAGRRLQMGDRPRNLRLSAGRADQLSRHRGAACRGAETGRAGARRGAALRQRSRRRRSSASSRWPANTMSISTCISMSATTRRRCTSTRSSS